MVWNSILVQVKRRGVDRGKEEERDRECVEQGGKEK